MGDNTQLEGRRLSLREGFERSGLTIDQAWTDYLITGGIRSRQVIAAALRGEARLERYEHDKLAAALNDIFTEAGLDHPIASED